MSNTTSSPEDIQSILTGINIFKLTFLALVMLSTIFGNILVCLVILKNKQLRTASNYFIVNVAIGDILVSLTSMPMAMIFIIYRRGNWLKWNIVFDAVWFGFTLLSFINVTVIACERYLAVMRPFYYQAKMTKRRARICCCCVWIYITLLISALAFTFKTPQRNYSFLIPGYIYYSVLYIHVAVVFTLVPFLYQRIFFVAEKHKVRICRRLIQEEKRKNYYLQMKATWTVGLVILLFVLVWLPFLVKQLFDVKDILAGHWDTENSAVTYVTYCNGAVNVFVYSFRDTRIRNALGKLLMLKKCFAK